MGIEANFTRADVSKRFYAFFDVIGRKGIVIFQKVGEMCLTEARNNKGYMMQSGALLSSTGYQVCDDGVIIHSRFDAASGAESDAAAKGIKAGQEIADKVGKETENKALIMVAGMKYAAYLEAMGYNVLSSAKHLADRELPPMFEKLITNIKRAAE